MPIFEDKPQYSRHTQMQSTYLQIFDTKTLRVYKGLQWLVFQVSFKITAHSQHVGRVPSSLNLMQMSRTIFFPISIKFGIESLNAGVCILVWSSFKIIKYHSGWGDSVKQCSFSKFISSSFVYVYVLYEVYLANQWSIMLIFVNKRINDNNVFSCFIKNNTSS